MATQDNPDMTITVAAHYEATNQLVDAIARDYTRRFSKLITTWNEMADIITTEDPDAPSSHALALAYRDCAQDLQELLDGTPQP